MNAQQFLTWMRNPGSTSREESAQLDALLDAFPYFQSGHLLYIKNLHNQGSFLYNNQLKTAAAYAVNRKVLYQLITLKQAEDERRETGVESSNPDSAKSALDSARSEKSVSTEELSHPDSIPSDKTSPENSEHEEQIAEPLKFPPKKFTQDPDEWEAGMLRQLQLLHHWRKSENSELRIPNSEKTAEQNASPTELRTAEQPDIAEEVPAAKDEINTLLYVLVEPGQPEDLDTETTEEFTEIAEEPVHTEWEIKLTDETESDTTSEEPEELKTEAVKSGDPVQQEILLEAIHSTFELEVDDKLPSAEELRSVKTEPIAETPAAAKPEPVAETTQPEAEVVVDSFEKMSFSDWLKEVSKKKAPAELPKTPLSGDKLIDQFIKEEPRIKVKKGAFFNPVNMAKKSVQESDEFLTETLARIYAKQGNYPKAIRAYQKLSLKFPEKTAYFAALIEELKRTPNK
jgi:hypothetical protein